MSAQQNISKKLFGISMITSEEIEKNSEDTSDQDLLILSELDEDLVLEEYIYTVSNIIQETLPNWIPENVTTKLFHFFYSDRNNECPCWAKNTLNKFLLSSTSVSSHH